MLLAHFGPAQADVYIPSIVALTIAAIAVALPLVFAPALRSAGRLAMRVVAGVVAVAAVAVAVVLAIPAQHTLAAQVPSLQRQIAARYGLHLPDSVVTSLIDGSTVDAATAEQYTHTNGSMKLEGDDASGYVLVSTLASAETPTQLPVKQP